MASLRPRIGGGRPRRIDDAAREEIRAIALARPRDLGEPGTRWSLATLRRYLVRKRVVTARSPRSICAGCCSRWGSPRSGPGPGSGATTRCSRRRRAGCWPPTRAPRPAPSTVCVVSFDECGPISLKPHAGQGWFAEGSPAASGPPTTAHGGTRKLMGAYDVGADRLWGHVEKRPVTGRGRARVPPRHPSPLPDRGDRLHRDGQPLGPLDARHPPMGGRQQRRSAADADQRQSPQPHRVPLLGLRRVRRSRAATTPTGPSSPRPPRPTSDAATATTTTRASSSSRTAARSPELPAERSAPPH